MAKPTPSSTDMPLKATHLLLLFCAPLADGSMLRPTKSGASKPIKPLTSTTIGVVVKPASLASPSNAAAYDLQSPAALSPQGAPYWFDERIHRFGNIGIGGRFHALVAPLVTHLIDRLSYDGVDVRKRAHALIRPGSTVLDLCCGTGFSTPAGATGVDTSDCMLGMAKFVHSDCTFVTGNAETYGEPFSKDVVTIMFAMHEMPRDARKRVLANAARIARHEVGTSSSHTLPHAHAHAHAHARTHTQSRTRICICRCLRLCQCLCLCLPLTAYTLARRQVVVVDIDPVFKLAMDPTFKQDFRSRVQSESFLSGEPYVLEYLKNIDSDVKACARARGWQSSDSAIMPGHVRMWKMTRARREFDI